MNKKAVISIIILVIIGFIGGAYFILRDDSTSDEGTFFGIFPDRNTDTRGLQEDRGPVDDFIDTQDDVALERGGFGLVTDKKVAGAVVFASTTESINDTGTSTDSIVNHFVRFVEMGTGHMYEVSLKEVAEERISNTTIHKTNNAVWTPDGKVALIQYENESGTGIKNFISYPTESGDDLGGEFLPENISLPSFSPDSSKLAYTQETGGGSQIITFNVNTKTNRVVSDFPLKELRVYWRDNQNLVLNTKPSHDSRGFAYLLNVNDGSFSKINGEINGLMTKVGPSGDGLYTYSTGGTFETRLVGTNNNTGLKTMAIDKCTWSSQEEEVLYCGVPSIVPRASYPDDWYMGSISFNDSLWQINAKNGAYSLIKSPENDRGKNFDIVNPAISEDGDFLIFENKKDHSLWLYYFGQEN